MNHQWWSYGNSNQWGRRLNKTPSLEAYHYRWQQKNGFRNVVDNVLVAKASNLVLFCYRPTNQEKSWFREFGLHTLKTPSRFPQPTLSPINFILISKQNTYFIQINRQKYQDTNELWNIHSVKKGRNCKKEEIGFCCSWQTWGNLIRNSLRKKLEFLTKRLKIQQFTLSTLCYGTKRQIRTSVRPDISVLNTTSKFFSLN